MMDADQVKKMIEAAEHCKTQKGCEGCPVESDIEFCQEECLEYTIALKAHHEAQRKADKAAWIAEVRAWAEHHTKIFRDGLGYQVVSIIQERLIKWLDEQEAWNG